MSAIERCRTAALGGHVARCENVLRHTVIAYNSCRNRHCPKCQGAAAREWLAEREAELLPVPYFHVVFTLPAPIADIAYQNKAVIYDLLFKASAETTAHDRGRSQASRRPDRHHVRAAHLGLGDDPPSARAHDRAGRRVLARRHSVGRRAGRASSCPCACSRACSARLFLEKLVAAHQAGELQFFGEHAALADTQAFAAFLAPLRKHEVGGLLQRAIRRPRGGACAISSRYTHRVAISNRRLIACDDNGVTFKWKDYRIEGPERYKMMTLATHEFIRRFLMHVLPEGLPPHPPLWPARQRQSRRQHRPRPRAARAAADAARRAIKAATAKPTSRACCRIPAPAAAAA